MGYVFFRGQPSQFLSRGNCFSIRFNLFLPIFFVFYSDKHDTDSCTDESNKRSEHPPDRNIFRNVYRTQPDFPPVPMPQRRQFPPPFSGYRTPSRHPAQVHTAAHKGRPDDKNSLSFFAESFFPKTHSWSLPAFLWYENAQTSPAKKGRSSPPAHNNF